MLREQLIRLLERVDGEFETPLSQRLDIAAYVDKMMAHAALFPMLDAGRLAGFVAMYCNDPASRTAYITMVAVDPASRATGLGSGLVRTAIAHARRIGCEKVALEVYKSNLNAFRLYTKLGFGVARETAGSAFLELPLQAGAGA